MRIVDGAALPLPHDGLVFDNLQERGLWGGCALTDPYSGCHQEPGNEWIGSIELESIIIGYPATAAATAIGVGHPKRDERSVMVVVLKVEAR